MSLTAYNKWQIVLYNFLLCGYVVMPLCSFAIAPLFCQSIKFVFDYPANLLSGFCFNFYVRLRTHTCWTCPESQLQKWLIAGNLHTCTSYTIFNPDFVIIRTWAKSFQRKTLGVFSITYGSEKRYLIALNFSQFSKSNSLPFQIKWEFHYNSRTYWMFVNYKDTMDIDISFNGMISCIFQGMPQNQFWFILDQLNSFFIMIDRKSTRLNSSHANISYAVFSLKKKY